MVYESTVQATRLPDGGTGRWYALEFLRPSWRVAALLVCDARDRPVQLEIGSDLGHWHNNAGEVDPASVTRVSRE